MPSKSRDRHLAKNAERRRQARRQSDRNKKAALGVGGAIAGVLLILLGIGLLSRNDEAAPGATPLPTVSATGGGSSEPTRTGTVEPTEEPAETVACGGEVPAAADKPKPQFDRAPAPEGVLDKGTTYTAVLETSCGTITIELDHKAAPDTVASFVFLAEQGYFDGQFFHRVVDSIDVVQGGSPTGAGDGGPGYVIPDELSGTEHYTPGTIAMANAGANTGGSQFFVVTGPEGANLDGAPNYTIFGSVADGLDIAKRINGLMATDDGTYDGAPTEAVYIESVSIERSKTGSPVPSPGG